MAKPSIAGRFARRQSSGAVRDSHLCLEMFRVTNPQWSQKGSKNVKAKYIQILVNLPGMLIILE